MTQQFFSPRDLWASMRVPYREPDELIPDGIPYRHVARFVAFWKNYGGLTLAGFQFVPPLAALKGVSKVSLLLPL